MHRTPTPQQWLLLGSGSLYKFALTGFHLVALKFILSQYGYSLDQLSWIYLAGSLEAGKILFSAGIEYRRLPVLGRFRGWMLISAFILALCFAALITDPREYFAIMLAVSVIMSAASVVFGCAMLGLTCVILPPASRDTGGVIQTIAARGGTMIGGALALYLFGRYGFPVAAAFMLILTLLIILQLLLFREHAEEHAYTAHTLTLIAQRALSFFQNRASLAWLILLALITAPFALLVSTFAPRLRELGYSAEQAGMILGLFMPALAMCTAPLSALLARRYPRGALLRLMLLAQIPMLFAFVFTDTLHAIHPWLPAAQIILFGASYTMLLPVVYARVFDQSQAQFAALDTALQYSATVLGSYLAGFAGLRLAQACGYPATALFAAAGAAVLAALALWRWK